MSFLIILLKLCSIDQSLLRNTKTPNPLNKLDLKTEQTLPNLGRLLDLPLSPETLNVLHQN